MTLAEVLITLGIIGVVAAFTVPTLINNVQDQQYKTTYKKAFSTAQQALTMANQQGLVNYTESSSDTITPPINFLAFMSQFKIAKQCTSGGDNTNCWDSSGEKYYTGQPNNSCFAFVDASGFAWTNLFQNNNVIAVDTNSFQKPNQYGKDRFLLRLNSDVDSSQLGIPIKVVPFSDNYANICSVPNNKCAIDNNYFGTSWLYK